MTTRSGVVVGVAQGPLAVYRGIPYAAPPVGERRFRPPAPHPGWDQPLQAVRFGPLCPQGAVDDASEDCLTLNIWTHRDGGRRPVMVFIHGGAYLGGAGSERLFEGSRLAIDGDVVVVTLNYRLGALGFLADASLRDESPDRSYGNYGLRDQQMALRWVRDNIEAFGGDPERVTIFGESVGGASICQHLAAPSSRGLFQGAIIESSGGCYGSERTGASLAAGRDVVERLGCGAAPDIPACLRGLDVAAFLSVAPDLPHFLGLTPFSPVIDGVLLREEPLDAIRGGRAAAVPVVIGSNADEYNAFLVVGHFANESAYRSAVADLVGTEHADDVLAIYSTQSFPSLERAYVNFVTDWAFVCPTLIFAAAAGAANPTYVYHFSATVGGTFGPLDAYHGLELHFVFDTFDSLHVPDAADLDLALQMRRAWASFAADGVPAFPGGEAWPRFDPADPRIEILDTPPVVQSSIREGRCAALASLGIE